MSWAEHHKPAATVPMHLMLAWLMWALVGATLAGFGAWWLWSRAPGTAPWIAALAVVAGAAKSRLVLDRAARRIIGRIRERGDGRCLGGFLSLRTWGLVVLMMGAGRFLRSSVARDIVAPIYLAAGTALCLSSRLCWRAWIESQRRPGGSRSSPDRRP
jgi:hypothetical protein